MACQVIGNVIACGSGRTARCSCGCGRQANVLCDYPTERGTCDKKLSHHCARYVGRDRHFCKGHPPLAGEQLALIR